MMKQLNNILSIWSSKDANWVLDSWIDYALPVWGPSSLNKTQMAHLRNPQNRGIHITRCLRKYNHVTLHRHQLNWLPISDQIMFKSVCAMYCHYHYDKQTCLLLDPPIVFGAQHDNNTRSKLRRFCKSNKFSFINHQKVLPFLSYKMVEFTA